LQEPATALEAVMVSVDWSSPARTVVGFAERVVWVIVEPMVTGTTTGLVEASLQVSE